MCTVRVPTSMTTNTYSRSADGRGAAALPGHHRIWVLSGPGQHRKADARDTIVWRPVRADYTMQREWKVGCRPYGSTPPPDASGHLPDGGATRAFPAPPIRPVSNG
jgi:hypothetical protein